MRYLSKSNALGVILSGASYENQGSRTAIKRALLNEQNGFCAYSEKYVCEIDETHIEHFDPRLKPTDADDYRNWYASISWMNSHKPKKIEPYLPILSPGSSEVRLRIKYSADDNLFEPTITNDMEAYNLIKYLGFNKNELAVERAKHIYRIKEIVGLFNSIQEALDFMANDKNYFSYVSALEIVFGVDLTEYITRNNSLGSATCMAT